MSIGRLLLAAALVFPAACSKPRAPAEAPPRVAAVVDATTEVVAKAPHRHARVHEGSVVALSVHENAIYVADEDRHLLVRVALPLDVNVAPISLELPGAPAQVLALDGEVLVTIREPGLLLTLRPDPEIGFVEISRIELPADAWGIAITPDEKRAIVTSAWTHRASLVDLASQRVGWSVDVAREPRGVVVRPDGESAYVTHLVGRAVTRLDGIQREPAIRRIDLPPAPLSTLVAAKRNLAELDASLAYAAVLSPEGDRLFVPRHALGALGKRAWFGRASLDVLLTSDDTPLAPERTRKGLLHVGQDIGNRDITITGDGDPVPIQFVASFTQPRAVVFRSSTRTLLVAGEGDDLLAELEADAIDPALKPRRSYDLTQPYAEGVPHCGAPSGVALSRDEKRAYVYCRTTGDLADVELDSFDSNVPFVKAPIPTVHLVDERLPASTALGRRLFFSGRELNISEGLACAGCHPDGRDDGHVWHELNEKTSNQTFLAGGAIRAAELGGDDTQHVHPGFPRQTPMLAGRVAAEGPYGWHGYSRTLPLRIALGTGLHRWDGANSPEGTDMEAPKAIAAFLREGLVPPPREDRPLTRDEERGRAVFLSENTGCASCHAPTGGEYTDRAPMHLGEMKPMPGFEDEDDLTFKTPSLRFVGGTAPYFHDGRYATLEDLVNKNHDTMGSTEHLSKKDRAALVAFLRTL